MRYELILNKVTSISRSCLSTPKEEDFEMYLRAFIEDINYIDGVFVIVNLFDVPYIIPDKIILLIETEMCQKEFKDKLEPVLSQYFCFFRFGELKTY